MKHLKKLLSSALACTLIAAPIAPANVSAASDTVTVTYKYFENGKSHTREMEALGRGIVAYQCATGIYVGWRLLGDEATVTDGVTAGAPSFELYRDGDLIATVSGSTNYVDTEGDLSSVYTVMATSGVYANEVSDEVSAWSSGVNYYDTEALTPPDDDVVITTLEPYSGASYSYETGTDSSGNTTYTYTFTYSPNDTSIGDLDGDGEYELVVKWMPSNSRDNMGGYTSPVYLMAYELDGTPMWDDFINLGQNVQAGAHHTQFLVYDFDQDGVAEIICQTAPGSQDSADTYVSTTIDGGTSQSYAEDSYYPTYTVDSSGYAHYGYFTSYNSQGSNDYQLLGLGNNITSAEYLSVFKGSSGEVIDTIDFPIARVSASTWGDNFGNRCNRFLADVAYLDGSTPTAVYWRGYYYGQSGYDERTGIAGINFNGSTLSVDYRFDTYSGQPGYQSDYADFVGQGNHNLTVADVDDDGCDEVISGAMCVEAGSDSGSGYSYIVPKWCTFRGHGDALHIGNYDPTHEGLEFYTVHEEGGGTETPYLCIDGTSSYASESVTLDYGQSVIDAQTGETLFHSESDSDNGRGLMANLGMGGYYQIGGGSAGYYMKTDDGFETSTLSPGSNFRIFWDGDLYDESLDSTIVDYDEDLGELYTNTEIDGEFNNSTKNNVCLQADIFGDWREEVVVWTETSAGIVLRVYASAIPTNYAMPTLMHDPVYRSGVAAEQTAYNQPPHIGYYVDPSQASSVTATTTAAGDLFSEDFESYSSVDAALANWSGLASFNTSLKGDDNQKLYFYLEESGNRYASLPFTGVTSTDEYEISFDAALYSGKETGYSSQIAVLQSDATYNGNAMYGTTGGYLFMLTACGYSTDWTLYNSNAEAVTTISVPALSMCRFTVTVTGGVGYLTVYNLANNTKIIEDFEFAADTSLAPASLYYCASRSYSEAVFDNISVSNLASTEVTLNQTSATLTTGGTATLTATVTPETVSSEVTWSSSDETVATVSSSGVVTAVAPGTATITATSVEDTTVSASCEVTVNPTLTVTVSGTGGSVYVGGSEVTGTQSFEISYGGSYTTAIRCNDHYMATVTTDGDAEILTLNNSYGTYNVCANTMVNIVFSPIFNISTSLGELSISVDDEDIEFVSGSAFVRPANSTSALTVMMNHKAVASDDVAFGSTLAITGYTVTVTGGDLDAQEFTPTKSDLFDDGNYYMAQIYGDGIDTDTEYEVTTTIDYYIGNSANTFTYTTTETVSAASAVKTLRQYYYTSNGANVALFVYE